MGDMRVEVRRDGVKAEAGVEGPLLVDEECAADPALPE